MLKKIKVVSKLVEWVLFVFLLGILAIILSPYLPIKNVPKTFIVATGSMEPFIKTGSVVFVKSTDPKTIKKGDIIAFTSPSNSKDTILHRVDSIKSTEPLTFSTKGDANNAPDAWDVIDVGVKGVYLGAIPYIGHAGAFAKKPLGFILIIGLPALLFIVSQILNIKKAISEEIDKKVAQTIKSKNKSSSPKININTIIILLTLFSILVGLSGIQAIKASFTDTVSLSGISISVKDFIVPSTPQNLRWLNPNVSCGGHTNSYTITADWDNSTDNLGIVKYEYEITYPKISGGVGVWRTFITPSSYSGVFNQAEGLHVYRVRSYDAENNVSNWSNTCSITYDKTLPASEITYPFNSNGDNKIQYTYIWNGKVEGTSLDNSSGIDHVELSVYRSLLDLYWNGSDWVHGSETATRVIAVGTTTWEYQFVNIPPLGRFRIIAHAVDKAGNIENSAIIEFENTAPEVVAPPTLVNVPIINLSSNPTDNKINLKITNILSPMDYEITYTGNSLEKGIIGHISQEEIIDSSYSKDFYLGTCTTGGNCTPEIVENGSVIIVDLIGTETISKTFIY